MVGSALSATLMKRGRVESYMKVVFAAAALALAVPFFVATFTSELSGVYGAQQRHTLTQLYALASTCSETCSKDISGHPHLLLHSQTDVNMQHTVLQVQIIVSFSRSL